MKAILLVTHLFVSGSIGVEQVGEFATMDLCERAKAQLELKIQQSSNTAFLCVSKGNS